jgi:hypothetical protein
MRLTANQRELARKELLQILEICGPCRTTELVGTPFFHGHRTLSPCQVRHLLRESGRVSERTCGQGVRTWSEWQIAEGQKHEGGAQ